MTTQTLTLPTILALGAVAAHIMGLYLFGAALAGLGLASYIAAGGDWKP